MSEHAVEYVWLSANGSTHAERGVFIAECRCGWFGPDRRDERAALADGDRHLAAEQVTA